MYRGASRARPGREGRRRVVAAERLRQHVLRLAWPVHHLFAPRIGAGAGVGGPGMHVQHQPGMANAARHVNLAYRRQLKLVEEIRNPVTWPCGWVDQTRALTSLA